MEMVSVIIPAYNAATLIENAIKSLSNQTFKDFEIIIVDDCSSDGTPEIAGNALKSGGLRCRIIRHDRNRGVSAARNTGLAAARGEYVIFLDADDMTEKNFIACLHNSIVSNSSDAAFCGYKTRELSDGKEKLYPSPAPDSSIVPEDILRLRVMNKVTMSIWAAIYRKDFLLSNGLKLTEGCTAGEDLEFVVKVLAAAKKISFVSECLYIYIQHDAMGNRSSKVSREKTLMRYIHHTEAHFREAEYIRKHCSSAKNIVLADNYIMPTGYQRLLSVYAAKDRKEEFDRLLTDKKIRGILLSSSKYFFDKPEVFIKSVIILLFPDYYYRRYRRRFAGY